MNIRLITRTTGVIGTEYNNRSIDDLILGQARVSSGRTEENLFDEPYKLIRHCVHNGHWCFDKDTEILTSEGFKNVENISTFDRIGSYNKDTGVVQYIHPYAVNRQQYDGIMYGFSNKNLDFLVTPNHRILIKNSKDELNVAEASHLYDTNRSCKFLTFANSNVHVNYIDTFDSYNNNIYKLIGFFIGDGTTKSSYDGLSFHLRKPRKIEYLKKICDLIGLELYIKNDNYIVKGDNIKNIFSKLFYNDNSEKILPKIFTTLSDDNKHNLLEGLIQSDGNISNNVIRYDTTSLELVSILQAIFCTLGFRILVSKRKKISDDHKERYILVFSKQLYTCEKSGVKGGWYTKEYKDWVYCVSVEDQFLITRRNNKISISGNSIFELANLGFEIKTSRAMGRELLRHGKVIGLTEFSQRYSSDIEFEEVELRKQSISNRQSSTEVIDPNIFLDIDHLPCDDAYFPIEADSAIELVNDSLSYNKALYKGLLNSNIAKESARMVLPETTQTTIYMNGRIREWITFLNQRLHKTAQKEIRVIAENLRDIFIKECPLISKALFNFEDAYDVHILDRIVLEKYKVYDKIIKK